MDVQHVLFTLFRLFLNLLTLSFGGGASLYVIATLSRVPEVAKQYGLPTNLAVTSAVACLVLVPIDTSMALQDLVTEALGWKAIIPSEVVDILSVFWTIFEVVFVTSAAGLAVFQFNVVTAAFMGGRLRGIFMNKVRVQRLMVLVAWIVGGLIAIPGLTTSIMANVEEAFYGANNITLMVVYWLFLVIYLGSLGVTILCYTKLVIYVKQKGDAVMIGIWTPISQRRSLAQGRSSLDSGNTEHIAMRGRISIIHPTQLEDIHSVANCLSRLSEVEGTQIECCSPAPFAVSEEGVEVQSPGIESVSISHLFRPPSSSVGQATSVLPGCTEQAQEAGSLPILTPLILNRPIGACLLPANVLQEDPVENNAENDEPQSAGASSAVSFARSRISACGFVYPFIPIGLLPTSPGAFSLISTQSVPSTVSTLTLPKSLTSGQSRNSVGSTLSSRSRRSFLLISPGGSFPSRKPSVFSQIGCDLQSVHEQPHESESNYESTCQAQNEGNEAPNTTENNKEHGQKELPTDKSTFPTISPAGVSCEESEIPSQDNLGDNQRESEGHLDTVPESSKNGDDNEQKINQPESNEVGGKEGNSVADCQESIKGPPKKLPPLNIEKAQMCSAALKLTSNSVSLKKESPASLSRRSSAYGKSSLKSSRGCSASSTKSSVGCQTTPDDQIGGSVRTKRNTLSTNDDSRHSRPSLSSRESIYSRNKQTETTSLSSSSGTKSGEAGGKNRKVALHKRRGSRSKRRKPRMSKTAWTNVSSASTFHDAVTEETAIDAASKEDKPGERSGESRSTLFGRGQKYRVMTQTSKQSSVSLTHSQANSGTHTRESLTVPLPRQVSAAGSSQVSISPTRSDAQTPTEFRALLQQLFHRPQVQDDRRINPQNKTVSVMKHAICICLCLFVFLIPHIIVKLYNFTSWVTDSVVRPNEGLAIDCARAFASLLFAFGPYLYVLDNKTIMKMLRMRKPRVVPLIHVN